MTKKSTPPPERLINLVIGLASSRIPVTRAVIRKSYLGYQHSVSEEAFERLFERDKDMLRSIGIPIITVTNPIHEDEVGYLIDTDAYELPPIQLTPEQTEIALLAASLWREASFQEAAERGVTKLRASGAAISGMRPPPISIRTGATSPNFSKIFAAIQARRVVEFSYRAASTGREGVREIQPWQLFGRSGVWYVVGFDLERENRRMFRLDRINGTVKLRGNEQAFEVPTDFEVEKLWESSDEEITAQIAVVANKGQPLRNRAQQVSELSREQCREYLLPSTFLDGDMLMISVRDVNTLARTIASFGDSVVAIAPRELRTEVKRLLIAGSVLGKSDV